MSKYLIVGLGNVGPNYTNTRHNIGFDIIDHFCLTKEIQFVKEKNGFICKFKLEGKTIYLLKPSTYMNLSGNAIKYYLNYYKVSLKNLLVIADDLNLDFGKIKLRTSGGHGGHNGHRNIIENLNSSNYCRIKFGIGKSFQKGEQVKYVLSKWSLNELESLSAKIDICYKMIVSFILSGPEITMNNLNK